MYSLIRKMLVCWGGGGFCELENYELCECDFLWDNILIFSYV